LAHSAFIGGSFNKTGGQLVPTGSLEFMFSRKAVFQIKKTDTLQIDELELTLIDAGLENTEIHEDIVYVYADFTDFGNMSKALETCNVEVLKSELQRIPNTSQDFTEEQLVDIEKLLDKIEEDDDVQAVYTNIA
jgi:transcriptional/translational regulatory protein YebC/TACO1